MNVLDENIVESQRQLLRSWRIHVRQIGHEVGRAGMQDEEIISLLRRTGRATFFTRDLRFYEAKSRAVNYCVVCLAVGQHEVAVFVRNVLRHSTFNTQAKRTGKVIRATHTGIRYWAISAPEEITLNWKESPRRTGPRATPRR